MKAFFQKYRHILENLLLLFVLAAGFLWMQKEYGQQRMQQEIAGKILRFHVRANSDSKEDQALKLKVRNAVGAFMQRQVSDTENLAQYTTVVQEHLSDIIETAQRTVRQEGYTYPVSARIETADFPEKTYGSYTFPAGDYQALNVIIGSGKGQNWWCVMYPNMCFRGAVYKVEDAKAEQALRRVLSEDEYDAVRKSGKYRIRFKYLDFLNKLLP